jgi:hypothetical protein
MPENSILFCCIEWADKPQLSNLLCSRRVYGDDAPPEEGRNQQIFL